MEDTQEHIGEQVEEVEEQVEEQIKENVEEVKSKVEEIKEDSVEAIKEDINKLKDDVKGVAENVKETVASKVEATTSSAKATINELKQAVSCNAGCPYSMTGEFSMYNQLNKISKVVQKNPSFDTVKRIILWDDIIQTGILFAIINFVFILVSFCNYSLISLFGYTAFTVTLTSILFHLISLVLSKYVQGVTLDNPLTDQLKTLSFHVHDAVIEKQVSNVGELVNTLLSIAKDIFSCKSVFLSGQFAIVFYFIGMLSKCLSNTCILYITFLVSFILPRVYAEKKELIDQQCANISALLKEPLNKLHSLIPQSNSNTTSTKKSN